MESEISLARTRYQLPTRLQFQCPPIAFDTAAHGLVAESNLSPLLKQKLLSGQFTDHVGATLSNIPFFAATFGFAPFTTAHHKLAVEELIETAMQTDKGVVPCITNSELDKRISDLATREIVGGLLLGSSGFCVCFNVNLDIDIGCR
jgi:hypothetical protein